jgi:hypothetical protein
MADKITAAEMRQQLKDRLNQQTQAQPVQTQVQPEPRRDRWIQGTYLDDDAIAVLKRVATPVFILIGFGMLYLILEKYIGAKNITPWRIWGLALTCLGYMWVKDMRVGLGGWLAILSVSTGLSGYFLEFLIKHTGVR